MKKVLFLLLLSQHLLAQTEKMVLTPGGYKPQSHVHRVEKGCRVVKTASGFKKVNTHGETLEMYARPAANKQIASPQKVDTTFGDGWITYAYWSNTSANPISYFSTDWIVPTTPLSDNGQTVFLFNGIDPANYSDGILQPVLQWGPSACGGGSYWAIMNWYVTQSDAFYGDTLITVNDGDTLQGVMELTGQSGAGYSYSSYFTGYSGCTLLVDSLPELSWANQTMETYGITAYTDYPPDLMVKMNHIKMKTGSAYPTITWHKVNSVTDVGQHCLVPSNSATNGEVDLYFHNFANGFAPVSGQAVISCFPNPAAQTIRIENTNENSLLLLKNSNGQEVIRESFAGSGNLDVSRLPGGVYFLFFQNAKESFVKKIVIAR